MKVEPNMEHEANPAPLLDEIQVIDDDEAGDPVSITSSIMKAELWHNLEAVKVEQGTDCGIYPAPSFEDQLIEIKEIGGPIPIAFPAIKTEIQEELWDFTAVKDEAKEEKYEECVYSLDEFGDPQEEFINSVKPELNTDGQKVSVDSFDSCSTSSHAISAGQGPHKWKMRSRHARPGENPSKSDTHNRFLSVKASSAVECSDHRENKPYNCEFCMKSFSSKHRLVRHCSIHTERKVFKCNICSQRFFEKETLAIHVLVHSGTLSYSHWRKAIEM
ncbi:zinc finger protein 568-like isoform X2 [Zootermopsis nevadensis]|uniref:zinc finger protein 568-like isoform X2 n=1 Tax=Zootermopsis nevadensis TaxID=136037 RepID=UPI000B8E2730|nr:zinc finger protein 568-like isoform X2 [Zootermopsis nevadensis]